MSTRYSLLPQTDKDRIAIDLLLLDLLAKPVQRDGLGGRALEADFIRTRGHEVRQDEAVLGAEHDPSSADWRIPK